MPKITKKWFSIGSRAKEYQIFYTTKNLQFTIQDFPQEVLQLGNGGRQITGKSIDELYQNVQSVIDTYLVAMKKTRKVIIYSVGMSSAMAMNRTGPGSFSGYKSWVPKGSKIKSGLGFGGDLSHSLGFGFQVFMEVVEKDVRYHKVEKDGTLGYGELSHNHKDKVIIDWTQEREDNFNAILASMEILAERIGKVVGTEETMLTFLDSGKKLLS